jgi:hypothetical protein
MQSATNSRIKMGGAIINGYCESDIEPEFVRAHSESGSLNGGVANEVTLILKNVKTTCVDSGGASPCATDAGADKWPSFVCSFAGSDGIVTAAPPVQGLRVEDVSPAGAILGIGAVVKCEMPARENTDHDVAVSLAYHAGKTIIPIKFTGNDGANNVSITSTGSSPSAPEAEAVTAYPTASPTSAPVLAGCHTVVDLSSYYRACTSSAERPSQFFEMNHASGWKALQQPGKWSFYRSFVGAFTTEETRYFFCGNSRPGTETAFVNPVDPRDNRPPGSWSYGSGQQQGGPVAPSGEGGTVEWADKELHFETSHSSGDAWLSWDFTGTPKGCVLAYHQRAESNPVFVCSEPVLVTKVAWTWATDMR